MPPRIAYWASSFEADIEAVASEVACLRAAFPGSVTWGISPRCWVQCSWRRGFSLHPRLHWAFRGATWLLQEAFDVNHLFGGMADWFHLKAVRKRPTILTLAVVGETCDQALLQKVDRFAVEWPAGREDLERQGIEPGRIRLIFPPVDLHRFRPVPAPEGPFTVLFASSPDDGAWLEARGVPLILEAAALRPAMRFRLLWRPWGNSLGRVRGWLEEQQLSNVELLVGRFADMPFHYQRAHVTVVPFTRMDRCKPAPNSLIESLACGRPVVVTPDVGLSQIVSEERAGLICAPDAAGLAESLDRLSLAWPAFAERARRLAERHFGRDRFRADYERLYQELT